MEAFVIGFSQKLSQLTTTESSPTWQRKLREISALQPQTQMYNHLTFEMPVKLKLNGRVPF